jgi:dihydrofolate reductase
MRISIIAAVAENGVIGRGGTLPWHLSNDLKRFKQLTMAHTIVMGRRTWESILRPLPGRRMIVVSRQKGYTTDVDGVDTSASLNEAIAAAEQAGEDELLIVGGAAIYREALPIADRLYLTQVHASIDGDTRFPEIDMTDWRLLESRRHEADANNDHPWTFQIYQRATTSD